MKQFYIQMQVKLTLDIDCTLLQQISEHNPWGHYLDYDFPNSAPGLCSENSAI